MYEIKYEEKDIVIRFDKDSVDKNIISTFLENLEIEQIRKKSRLTPKQVQNLAKEVNDRAWKKIKEKYVGAQLGKSKPIIVDTNILISAFLQKNSPFSKILQSEEFQFYICEVTIIELFKHKEKIIKLSDLSEDELTKVFHSILKKLTLFKEDLIEKLHWNKAHKLCKGIDETDTPFVALTLELNGLLFTGDKKLATKLKAKGFDSFFEYSEKKR